MNKPTLTFIKLVFLSSILIAYLACCGGKGNDAPPAPEANMSFPLEREVMDWDIYPGRLQAPETANVAARVSGIIVSAPIHEGAYVKKGDVLFDIDDRPFKAEFASKVADVKRAEALVSQAEAQYKRYESLKGTKAISGEAYDQALAAIRQAQANLAASNAALEVSRLNLEWTKVTAPISGKVSRKYVTEGNLVNGGTGAATVLTSVTSVDPIYTYLTVPERVYLQYRTLGKEGNEQGQCSVQLDNEINFPHKGYIDFIDNQVDPSTGTIQMRCVLGNAKGDLTPGLYSKVSIQSSERYQTLLIPDSAISTDQNSKFVLVIGKDNTVEVRRIKTGSLFGKLRSIKEGLNFNDQVIITGLQKLRPGTKVIAKENTLEEDPAIAASIAAAKSIV